MSIIDIGTSDSQTMHIQRMLAKYNAVLCSLPTKFLCDESEITLKVCRYTRVVSTDISLLSIEYRHVYRNLQVQHRKLHYNRMDYPLI